MHGHTQWMSDDGAEVNGATAAGGNGWQEGGHHDIDDDEEFVAQDDNLDEDNNLDDDNNLADDEEVPLASVVRDPHLQDLLLEKMKGAKRKSKLEKLEIDSNTPLYDSGRGLGESRLRVALDVLQMKAKHGWTDTSVDDILEYVKDLLPAGNTCPGSLAEAKRITCPLDLPHEKYHACINDCIMYHKEHVDKTKCPVCDVERYKKGKKKAPRKVVWYFPPPPASTNVCESLLGTLLNMPDRTKDGPKARHDLKVLGIVEELQIPRPKRDTEEETTAVEAQKD
ncbi:hypothetical protein QYE76_032705 [Lolium multiflorum]|uniref:Uncharacterized protein n=1 Tax=Lolium multiflorum TaxID=4521 RepID=A0AAD8VIL3_LOLMU|nr:hypothetical protein QYE76_032705 [Lolium multiflorum]